MCMHRLMWTLTWGPASKFKLSVPQGLYMKNDLHGRNYGVNDCNKLLFPAAGWIRVTDCCSESNNRQQFNKESTMWIFKSVVANHFFKLCLWPWRCLDSAEELKDLGAIIHQVVSFVSFRAHCFPLENNRVREECSIQPQICQQITKEMVSECFLVEWNKSDGDEFSWRSKKLNSAFDEVKK